MEWGRYENPVEDDVYQGKSRYAPPDIFPLHWFDRQMPIILEASRRISETFSRSLSNGHDHPSTRAVDTYAQRSRIGRLGLPTGTKSTK